LQSSPGQWFFHVFIHALLLSCLLHFPFVGCSGYKTKKPKVKSMHIEFYVVVKEKIIVYPASTFPSILLIVATNEWITSKILVGTNMLLQYVVRRIQLYINCHVQYVFIYILFTRAKSHQLIPWCWPHDNHAVQSFERGISAQNSGAFAWEIVSIWIWICAWNM